MKTNKSSILSLQGLRGIAILLVIISHCSYYKNSFGNNVFMWCGGLGVSIFIMLSGFLEMRSLDYKQEAYFSRIYRKIKKIYPLHIITFLVAIPLTAIPYCLKDVLKYGSIFICNVFLVHSWIPSRSFYFSYNMVSWYLSTMVFFVIISPFINKKLKFLSKGKLIILALLMVFIELSIFLVFGKSNISHWIIYVFPVTRSIDFILGACGYYLFSKQTKGNKVELNIIYLLALFFIMLVISSFNSNSEIFATFVWTIPVFFMIPLVARNNIFLFENKYIIWLGNISFELYIIHQLIIRYFKIICSQVGVNENIFIYVIAIAVSIVLAKFINKLVKKIIV